MKISSCKSLAEFIIISNIFNQIYSQLQQTALTNCKQPRKTNLPITKTNVPMKDPYHKILNLFPEYANAENTDKALIEQLFHPVTLKKGSVLVEENSIPGYLYFINTGFIRVYYYHDGEAVTSHINCPNGFITSFGSFMAQHRSIEIVECITACSVLRISRKDLDLLYERSPKWAEAGRKIYDQSIVYNEQRTRDILTLSAEQRYLKLLNESPELIQQVPLQIIASFIGIKPESLSRIRRQLIS